MQTEKLDVLVIGAGPAGTVAASIVNKAGYKVKIVEKQKFPRFVIGESLLPRCMEALEEAGFLEAVKGKGFQEKFGAKFVKNGKICDYLFADQFTEGWNWTWQVPRAEFDKTLADTVESMGVPIAYETAVTAIEFKGSESLSTVEDIHGNKSQIDARFIIDGSGYGRVIPRLFSLDKPSNLPPRKALFAHTVDTKRSLSDEPNRITIVVHEPGVWVWIIPFSNGITSLGFVGDLSFFTKTKGNNEQQLRALIDKEPYLQERFKDVQLVFDPRVLESWSTTTNTFFGEGFVLTGNVTEFLDPVFSSGVTLATVSSQMAAGLVIRKLRGETIDWDNEYTKPMMQGVDTFRSFVTTWYEGILDTIFFADDQDPLIKSQICSVLAGYVWDTQNPYVKHHHNALHKLASIIEFRDSLRKSPAK
jgi:flavin-dependent dehydrogenase